MAEDFGKIGDLSVGFNVDLGALKSSIDASKPQIEQMAGGIGESAGKGFSEKFGEFVGGIDFKQFGQNLQNVASIGKTIGADLTAAITVPLVAIGAGATKVGIDFESAFTGVRKTVAATGPELDALSASFRKMATEIPVTAVELSHIGEAAGQLGIRKEDIEAFTKTMAILGTTTNLTSDEAATAVAKIQNIFGSAGQDVDRFAATLVALGNDGASTEKDIINMGLRIAAAGNQIGLSQGQVLGFASALSSVGLEAELGGTAISRVFSKMNTAVKSGSDALTDFAKIAGMSVEDFKQKFQTDAAGAVVEFIKGLDRIKVSGGDAGAAIESVVGKSVAIKDTLLRAAGAGDLLTRALDLQGTAWDQNSAHLKEAETRFKTTESQLILLKNQLTEVGITLFEAIGPVIRDVLIPAAKSIVDVLKDVADGFSHLSQPVQVAVLAIGALAAAAGPVILIVSTIIGGIGSAILALDALAVGMGVAGGAAGLLAIAFDAVAIAIGPVLIAIAAIGAALAALYLAKVISDWTGFSDVLKKAWNVLTDVVDVVKDVVSAFYNLGRAIAGEVWDAFKNTVAGAITKVKEFIEVVKGLVPEWMKTGANIIGGWIDAAANAASAAKGKIQGFTKDVNDAADSINDRRAAANWFNSLDPTLKSTAKSMADFRTEIFGASAETKAWFDSLNPKLQSTATNTTAFLAEVFKIKPAAKDAGGGLTGLGDDAEEGGKHVQTFKEKVADMVKELQGTDEKSEVFVGALKSMDAQGLLTSDRILELKKKIVDLKDSHDPLIQKLQALIPYLELTKLGYKDTNDAVEALQLGVFKLSQIHLPLLPLIEPETWNVMPPIRDAIDGLELLDREVKNNSDNIKADITAENTLNKARETDWKNHATVVKDTTADWNRAISTAIGNVVSDFSKGLTDMILGHKDFSFNVKGVWTELSTALTRIMVTNAFDPIFKAFNDLLTSLTKPISDFVSGLIEKITKPVTDLIGNFIGDITKKITGVLTNTASSFVGPQLAGSLGGAATGAAGSATSAIGGVGSAAAGTVSSLASSLAGGAVAAAGSIIGAFISKGNQQRTEENTRETRDWLELAVTAWNPLFNADTILLGQIADRLFPSLGDVIFAAAEGLRSGLFDVLWQTATAIVNAINGIGGDGRPLKTEQINAPKPTDTPAQTKTAAETEAARAYLESIAMAMSGPGIGVRPIPPPPPELIPPTAEKIAAALAVENAKTNGEIFTKLSNSVAVETAKYTQEQIDSAVKNLQYSYYMSNPYPIAEGGKIPEPGANYTEWLGKIGEATEKTAEAVLTQTAGFTPYFSGMSQQIALSYNEALKQLEEQQTQTAAVNAAKAETANQTTVFAPFLSGMSQQIGQTYNAALQQVAVVEAQTAGFSPYLSGINNQMAISILEAQAAIAATEKFETTTVSQSEAQVAAIGENRAQVMAQTSTFTPFFVGMGAQLGQSILEAQAQLTQDESLAAAASRQASEIQAENVGLQLAQQQEQAQIATESQAAAEAIAREEQEQAAARAMEALQQEEALAVEAKAQQEALAAEASRQAEAIQSENVQLELARQQSEEQLATEAMSQEMQLVTSSQALETQLSSEEQANAEARQMEAFQKAEAIAAEAKAQQEALAAEASRQASEIQAENVGMELENQRLYNEEIGQQELTAAATEGTEENTASALTPLDATATNTGETVSAIGAQIQETQNLGGIFSSVGGGIISAIGGIDFSFTQVVQAVPQTATLLAPTLPGVGSQLAQSIAELPALIAAQTTETATPATTGGSEPVPVSYSSGGSDIFGSLAAGTIPVYQQGGIAQADDELAILHKREMVLPAHLAEGIQSLIEAGGFSGLGLGIQGMLESGSFPGIGKGLDLNPFVMDAAPVGLNEAAFPTSDVGDQIIVQNPVFAPTIAPVINMEQISLTPLEVREQVLPEITQALDTNIRGYAQKWVQLIVDRLKGITHAEAAAGV